MISDFRSSVFKLCKLLQKDNRVEKIRETIHNLQASVQNYNATQILKQNHGDFGYIASNQHTQFLGYLFTDESVDKINKQNPFHVTHLDEEERFVIEEAHETIVFFIDACIHDLKLRFPKSMILLDPYSQYRQPEKKTDAKSFLNSEQIDECIYSFRSGKLYHKIIQNDALMILEDTDSNMLHQLSGIIRKQFTEDFKSISKETEEYVERLFIHKEPQMVDVLLTYCTYCYALRSSLQIASQMIFCAITGVSMLVMDNDNMIAINNHHSDSVYEKYVLLLNDIVISNGVGNIALLKCDLPNKRHIKEFGIIMELTVSLVTEFGSSSKVTMITVDEELKRIHILTDTILSSDLGKMPIVSGKTLWQGNK